MKSATTPLGVDLRVPVGAELGPSFEAPPDEHQFVCAIPGHAEAGWWER